MTVKPFNQAGRWANRRIRGRTRLRELPLAFSERRLLLFLGDVLWVNAALLLGLALGPRTNFPLALDTVRGHPGWFILLTFMWCAVATVMDAYDLKAAAGKLTGPIAALKPGLVVAVTYFFIPVWSAPLTQSRLSWGLFLLFAVIGLASWRFLYAVVLVQPRFCSRVLIIGAGWSGKTILAAIQDGYQTDYEVVGFIDDDPAKEGTRIAGVPVIGTRGDLMGLASEKDIQEVILAITHERQIHGDLFQAVMDCHETGVEVTPMAYLYEKLTGRVPVEHIGRQMYVLLPLNYSPIMPVYRMARRLLDIVVGVVGLLGLGLLLPFITAAICLDSRGPIFYRQTRVGKGGRPYRVIKLRTMFRDAEAAGEAIWARQNDDRVTRFGRFARKTRLDEIPQFWNVLKGEMSLIGPRPERPEFVEHLHEQIPFYRSRHVVKPGLTGWAQVNYGYGSSVEDALMKLQYDLYYVKHRSLYLDVLILVKTVGTVLSFSGT